MITKFALGALVVLMVGFSAAPGAIAGTTVVTPGPYQRWVNQSKTPTPNIPITVEASVDACPSEMACMSIAARKMYLPTGLPSRKEIFYHELGHQFDWELMTGADRRWFKRNYHRPNRVWLDRTGELDPDRPLDVGEFFAWNYGECALGQIQPWSSIGVGPDYEQLWSGAMRRGCRRIELIAGGSHMGLDRGNKVLP